jgi:hypothetical protein
LIEKFGAFARGGIWDVDLTFDPVSSALSGDKILSTFINLRSFSEEG